MSSEPGPSSIPAGAPGPSDGTFGLDPGTMVSRPTKKTTVDELRDGLSQLGLDTKGKKETLWRSVWFLPSLLIWLFFRLVKSLQRAVYPRVGDEVEEYAVADDSRQRAEDRWRSFLCFDVEATCRPGKDFAYPNEIIEFPVVLLQWAETPADERDKDGPTRSLKRVDTFHSYVKPTWAPILTDFCTALTGITQDMVHSAPTFPKMIQKLEKWMDRHGLRGVDGRLKEALWVTDGPWDLRDFIPKQLHITPLESRHPPYFFGPYLNIRQATQTVLCEAWRREQPSLDPNAASRAKGKGKINTAMLLNKIVREGRWNGPGFYLPIAGQVKAFGLGGFEGRQHSGLDDATNIARILMAISERDVIIESNAKTPHPRHLKKWPWMTKPGEVKWKEWMSDDPRLGEAEKASKPAQHDEEHFAATYGSSSTTGLPAISDSSSSAGENSGSPAEGKGKYDWVIQTGPDERVHVKRIFLSSASSGPEKGTSLPLGGHADRQREMRTESTVELEKEISVSA